jgi:hypothetical protein
MDYKKARYYIGCYFANALLLEENSLNNYDKTINSFDVFGELKLKQEGIRYIKGLNIKKIR